MGFFYENMEEKLASKEKLPMRGRKKLPLRGARGRRLQLLKDFEVGHIYTFTPYFATDLSDDLPGDLLLEDHTNEHCRTSYN